MKMDGHKPITQHHTSKLPSAKLTIAVIDDERRWLKAFERMFRSGKYAVDTFDDPRRFLATIFKHPQQYAGIICDIKMPQMDGYQVFEAIKNNPATQNIPFVVISGVLTQDNNLSKIQGVPYISKLDDDLRSKIFQELIEVIENWPKVRDYLRSQNVSDDKIDFFCQFFINYHKYFNEILKFINKMEVACVSADHSAIDHIGKECTAYISELQRTCMQIIALMQDGPETTAFISKLCQRGRTSVNMIQTYQLLLAEEPSTNPEFRSFLKECRQSLEKIIVGTEKGYNLRTAE
jgi:CheY-like chemotaxis protein